MTAYIVNKVNIFRIIFRSYDVSNVLPLYKTSGAQTQTDPE